MQYKYKDAFGHISQIEEAYAIQLIYHFTESEHCKGPSDGNCASIKKRLERLILRDDGVSQRGKVHIENVTHVALRLFRRSIQSFFVVFFIPLQRYR